MNMDEQELPIKSEEPQTSRQGVQVIERASGILQVLQQNPGGLSLGGIAKEVGLARSTVQRIVDALARESFINASASGRGFRLGPALIPLGDNKHFPIVELVRPTLEEIASLTHETVDLSLVNQEQMIFVDQILGAHRLTAVSAVGLSFPLHSAANGKATLALMSDTELERFRSHTVLTEFTKNTITDWDCLMKALKPVRESGLAFDREEHSEGISAVAMAIRTHDNDIIAISIPAPTERFAEKETELIDALTKSFKKIRQTLAG